MKLLDISEIRIERIDFTTMKQHPWREYELIPNTIGVTTLLREVAVASGKWSENEQDDIMPIRVLIGMGWEAICAQLYVGEDFEWQLGVFERDGISGHPDGINIVDGEVTLEEWKYTRRSLRVPGGKEGQHRDILAEWMWMNQVKAYCALHPALPLRARFHVCWEHGDYSGDRNERYFRYLIGFEPDEIDRTWEMLKKQKDAMKGITT